MNKYILTKVSKEVFGVKLFQIKALVAFGDVEKGALGGWIEKEGCLSQEGNAWVFGNACVFDNARVFGKLKLLAGFFFGSQYKNEEIKTAKIDEDYSVVYKGDARFGTDEPEQSLSGKKVSVELDGKKYTATID